LAALIADPIPVRSWDVLAKTSGEATTNEDICGSDH
jgi:hypothetical protein